MSHRGIMMYLFPCIIALNTKKHNFVITFTFYVVVYNPLLKQYNLISNLFCNSLNSVIPKLN